MKPIHKGGYLPPMINARCPWCESSEGVTPGKVAEELRALRRWAIEIAVITIIERKGLEELTVQDVADELGMAKGTVYLYFTSRDAMIAATAHSVRLGLARELEPAFESSVAECLTRLISCISRLTRGHTRLLRAVPERGPAGIAGDEWGWGWTRAQLLRNFDAARQRGEIRDVPLPAVATFVADYVEGLVARRESGAEALDAAEASTFVSVLLHGLASTSGPCPAST